MSGDCSILLDKTPIILKTGRKYEDREEGRELQTKLHSIISILRVFSLLNAVRNLPVVYLGKPGVRNAELKRNFGHPDGEVGIA